MAGKSTGWRLVSERQEIDLFIAGTVKVEHLLSLSNVINGNHKSEMSIKMDLEDTLKKKSNQG